MGQDETLGSRASQVKSGPFARLAAAHPERLLTPVMRRCNAVTCADVSAHNCGRSACLAQAPARQATLPQFLPCE